MSKKFASDFNGLRVHRFLTIQLNKELGAWAFTNGQDVYIGSGQYNPNSTNRQWLIADANCAAIGRPFFDPAEATT